MNSNTERMCGWHVYPTAYLPGPSYPTIEQRAVADDPYALEELTAYISRPDIAARVGAFASAAVAPFAISLELPAMAAAVALFNISADPAERTDLSSERPEIVQQLRQALVDFRRGEWLDPQWPPYESCDTATKSCAAQSNEYKAAAAAKGCVDSFVK